MSWVVAVPLLTVIGMVSVGAGQQIIAYITLMAALYGGFQLAKEAEDQEAERWRETEDQRE